MDRIKQLENKVYRLERLVYQTKYYYTHRRERIEYQLQRYYALKAKRKTAK